MTSRLSQIPELLVGAIECETGPHGGLIPLRLPKWTEAQHLNNMMIDHASRNGSGVRLEFNTTATNLQLTVRCSRVAFSDERAAQPMPLVVDIDGHRQELLAVNNAAFVPVPPAHQIEGQPNTFEIALPEQGQPKHVTIWLPHDGVTEIIDLATDAPATPVAQTNPRWVHYGSSISHSGEVRLPTSVWPVQVANQLDLNLYSLGLAGSAQLDGFAARTIVALKPDFVSLKLGINVVNANSLNLRSYPPAVNNFLDILREGLPTTPILLVSAIHCPPHEEGVGPTVFGPSMQAAASPTPDEFFPSTMNLTHTRQVLQQVFENRKPTDDHLWHMSGQDLLGAAEAHLLPDLLHPNEEGYNLIASRFWQHPTVEAWLGR